MDVQTLAIFRAPVWIIRPHQAAQLLGGDVGVPLHGVVNPLFDRRQAQSCRWNKLAAVQTDAGLQFVGVEDCHWPRHGFINRFACRRCRWSSSRLSFSPSASESLATSMGIPAMMVSSALTLAISISSAVLRR